MKKLVFLWILAAVAFGFLQHTTDVLNAAGGRQIAFKNTTKTQIKPIEIKELKLNVDSILHKTNSLSKLKVVNPK